MSLSSEGMMELRSERNSSVSSLMNIVMINSSFQPSLCLFNSATHISHGKDGGSISLNNMSHRIQRSPRALHLRFAISILFLLISCPKEFFFPDLGTPNTLVSFQKIRTGKVTYLEYSIHQTIRVLLSWLRKLGWSSQGFRSRVHLLFCAYKASPTWPNGFSSSP